MEHFRCAHQLQLPLDGFAALVLHGKQARPDQRGSDVCRPAVDEITEHQHEEEAEIVPLFLGGCAFFGGEEEHRDAGDAERHHLEEGEIHPAQHGKAVEHRGSGGCQ